MSVILLPGTHSYKQFDASLSHYYLVRVDEQNQLSQDPDPIWLPEDYDPAELWDAVQARQHARGHHYLLSVAGQLCILHRERKVFERMASLNPLSVSYMMVA